MVKSRDQSKGGRRRRQDGEETRLRIIEAALDSLREEGYAGATARSIAARGGFNPALIFYHFGSVDELFLAGLERSSGARLARYRAALEGVTDLVEFVRVLRRLYTEDLDAGHISAVQELVAASAFSVTMGWRLAAMMEPWFAFSEEFIRQFLEGVPFARHLNVRDLTFGMVSLYTGLETMTRLTGGDPARIVSLFQTAERVARTVGPLLGLTRTTRRFRGDR